MIYYQVADELVCRKKSSDYDCLFAVALLTAFFGECCDESSFSRMKQKDFILSFCLCSSICLMLMQKLFVHYKSNKTQEISKRRKICQIFNVLSSLVKKR